VFKILVGKLEGKIQLKRPKHRWGDTIKMNLRETAWDGVNWIHLVLVNTVKKLLFYRRWRNSGLVEYY
jgi:hypothetical protein